MKKLSEIFKKAVAKLSREKVITAQNGSKTVTLTTRHYVVASSYHYVHSDKEGRSSGEGYGFGFFVNMPAKGKKEAEAFLGKSF